MGFKVKRKIYRLSFQPDTGLDGLTVDVRGLSLGQQLKLREDSEAREKGGNGGDQAADRMVRLLADQLIEWDAEDEDGQPIPATLDGLLSQDTSFAMKIIDAWQQAVSAVSVPLPQTSSDGQPSLEASIPMDIPSESLAS